MTANNREICSTFYCSYVATDLISFKSGSLEALKFRGILRLEKLPQPAKLKVRNARR